MSARITKAEGFTQRSPTTTMVAVTGSQKPYILDTPHILSLPRMFESRFRYRHKWVAKEVVDEAIRLPDTLRERRLILLFHSQEKARLIPLRICTVVGLEDLGHFIFLRFRVGCIAHVDPRVLTSTDSEFLDSEASSLAKVGAQLLGLTDHRGQVTRDLSQPLPAGFYLRHIETGCPEPTWAIGDTPQQMASAWASLSAVLLSEPSLLGMPLFHVLGFQGETGEYESPKELKSVFDGPMRGIHGFQLTEGARYRLRVSQWCEPPRDQPLPNVRLNCDFDADNLQLEGASNRIVGRYDVLEFIFHTHRPSYSEITLWAGRYGASQLERSAPSRASGDGRGETDTTLGSNDWPALFTVRVPVLVQRPWSRVAARWAGGVLGVLLYLAAPRIAEGAALQSLQLLGLALAALLYDKVQRIFKLGADLSKVLIGYSTGSKG